MFSAIVRFESFDADSACCHISQMPCRDETQCGLLTDTRRGDFTTRSLGAVLRSTFRSTIIVISRDLMPTTLLDEKFLEGVDNSTKQCWSVLIIRFAGARRTSEMRIQ
jgi:hypothetical protein